MSEGVATGSEVVQVVQAQLVRREDALEAFAGVSGGIRRAQAIAEELKGIIDHAGLSVSMGGDREHLRVEAWCAAGALVGVSPRTVWARLSAEVPGVPGYTARVEVVRLADGMIVCAAEADCYADEVQKKRGGGYFFKWIIDSADYEELPTELPEHYALNRHALKSMAQCVPLDAEILTRAGWRRPESLSVGEEVLGYELAADRCAWTPLRAVNFFPAGAKPLIRLRSRSFDVVCTSDHTWAAVGSGYDRRRRLVRTDAFVSHGLLVAAGAPADGAHHAPRDAAVWGWLVTDGTIRCERGYWRAHIDQAKPEYVEKLRALLGDWITSETWTTPDPNNLTAAGRPWGRRPCARFALSAAALRGLMERSGISDPAADLLGYVTRLDGDSRRSMLEAMIDADGHRRTGRKGRWRFAKIKPLAIDVLHALCALEGLPLGRAHRVCADSEIRAWMLRRDRTVRTRFLRIEPAPNEPTWCPTTDLGTWIMRWRGQVTITGNTRATSKALAQHLRWIAVLGGYSGTPAEEMTGLERDSFERGVQKERARRGAPPPAAKGGATARSSTTSTAQPPAAASSAMPAGAWYKKPPSPGPAPSDKRISEGKGKAVWAWAFNRAQALKGAVTAEEIVGELCQVLGLGDLREMHFTNFGDERKPERYPNWVKDFCERFPAPLAVAGDPEVERDFVDGDRPAAPAAPAKPKAGAASPTPKARGPAPAPRFADPPDDEPAAPPDDDDAWEPPGDGVAPPDDEDQPF